MMSMTDKTLVCRDCRNEFVFTAGEQAFYAEKGFTNEPTRCPDCRRNAKAARNGGSSYSSGGGGGDYGFRSERSERSMHDAVCDACGRETQVPFVPTSGKPVYCSDCFRNQRDQRSSSRW